MLVSGFSFLFKNSKKYQVNICKVLRVEGCILCQTNVRKRKIKDICKQSHHKTLFYTSEKISVFGSLPNEKLGRIKNLSLDSIVAYFVNNS